MKVAPWLPTPSSLAIPSYETGLPGRLQRSQASFWIKLAFLVFSWHWAHTSGLTSTNSLKLLNDCTSLEEAKPNLLMFQNIESKTDWCHIMSNFFYSQKHYRQKQTRKRNLWPHVSHLLLRLTGPGSRYAESTSHAGWCHCGVPWWRCRIVGRQSTTPWPEIKSWEWTQEARLAG